MEDSEKTKIIPPGDKHVGRYRILAQVGQGGMGMVYKACDTKLDRIVALKTLPQLCDSETIQRFEREAKSNAKLHHPNIVTLYDFEQSEGKYFITMDFIEGGSLAQLLKRQPMPINKTCKIMLQILDAVGYAHQEGIIHRDLKPSNILMSKDGKPIVTDFGLAKPSQQSAQISRTGVVVGTPAYMSPEQAQGDVIDQRSDIFSLGAVFFEMLTGVQPFASENIFSVLHKIVNEPVPSPKKFKPELPTYLDHICRKALARNRENRYQSAAEMAGDIRKYLQGKAEMPDKTAQHAPVKNHKTGTLTRKKAVAVGKIKFRSSRITMLSIWVSVGLVVFLVVLMSMFKLAQNKTTMQTPVSEKQQAKIAEKKPIATVPVVPSPNQNAEEAGRKWQELTAIPLTDMARKMKCLYEFLGTPAYKETEPFRLAKELKQQLDQDSKKAYEYQLGSIPEHNYLVRWMLSQDFLRDYGMTPIAQQIKEEQRAREEKVRQTLPKVIGQLDLILASKAFEQFERVRPEGEILVIPQHRPILEQMARAESLKNYPLLGEIEKLKHMWLQIEEPLQKFRQELSLLTQEYQSFRGEEFLALLDNRQFETIHERLHGFQERLDLLEIPQAEKEMLQANIAESGRKVEEEERKEREKTKQPTLPEQVSDKQPLVSTNDERTKSAILDGLTRLLESLQDGNFDQAQDCFSREFLTEDLPEEQTRREKLLKGLQLFSRFTQPDKLEITTVNPNLAILKPADAKKAEFGWHFMAYEKGSWKYDGSYLNHMSHMRRLHILTKDNIPQNARAVAQQLVSLVRQKKPFQFPKYYSQELKGNLLYHLDTLAQLSLLQQLPFMEATMRANREVPNIVVVLLRFHNRAQVVKLVMIHEENDWRLLRIIGL